MSSFFFCFFLLQFKRAVHDITKPDHDDHYLVRWLRARKWNPEAAEKMFREVSTRLLHEFRVLATRWLHNVNLKCLFYILFYLFSFKFSFSVYEMA